MNKDFKLKTEDFKIVGKDGKIDIIDFILFYQYKCYKEDLEKNLENFSRDKIEKNFRREDDKCLEIIDKNFTIEFTDEEKDNLICDMLFRGLKEEIHPIYLRSIIIILINTLKNIKLSSSELKTIIENK